MVQLRSVKLHLKCEESRPGQLCNPVSPPHCHSLCIRASHDFNRLSLSLSLTPPPPPPPAPPVDQLHVSRDGCNASSSFGRRPVRCHLRCLPHRPRRAASALLRPSGASKVTGSSTTPTSPTTSISNFHARTRLHELPFAAWSCTAPAESRQCPPNAPARALSRSRPPLISRIWWRRRLTLAMSTASVVI